MRKKIVSLNLGVCVALVISFYVAYYLLIQDNCLHCSISSIINNSHNLELKRHLIVLGVLPIYIGMIIFGSPMLGIYIGFLIQKLLMRGVKDEYLPIKNSI